MVEINNQRKGVPRYAGVVGGTDNGRQKTRNHGYDVIVDEELPLITPITLANLSRWLKNSNQQAPDATASFPLVGCLPQAAWPEDFSEKSGRCGIAAD